MSQLLTLKELDRSHDGLGSKIAVLNAVHYDLASCTGSMEQVYGLLEENELQASRVLIDRGLAVGLTIEEAYARLPDYYKTLRNH